MIEVQVPYDDLLDILDLVARRPDGRTQLVLGLIAHTREDIRQYRAPDLRVILPTTSFPEDEALMRVINQDAVHGQLAAFVDGGETLCTLQTSIAPTSDESFVALKPAYFEDMKLSALWADVGDMPWNGSLV